jgi:hypothetical protein
MATTHVVPYGIIVELDHSEVTRIIAAMNAGRAADTIANLFGASGTAAFVLNIVGALLTLGANVLSGCDRGNGIFLYILWIPVLCWCRPR